MKSVVDSGLVGLGRRIISNGISNSYCSQLKRLTVSVTHRQSNTTVLVQQHRYSYTEVSTQNPSTSLVRNPDSYHSFRLWELQPHPRIRGIASPPKSHQNLTSRDPPPAMQPLPAQQCFTGKYTAKRANRCESPPPRSVNHSPHWYIAILF